MLPDRVSNPGPLTYESGALPIALRGPAGKVVVVIGRGWGWGWGINTIPLFTYIFFFNIKCMYKRYPTYVILWLDHLLIFLKGK